LEELPELMQNNQIKNKTPCQQGQGMKDARI
jgi:hypothetical protein